MVLLILSTVLGITWTVLQLVLQSDQIVFTLTKNLALSVEAVPSFIAYPMLAVINIMIVWALALMVKSTVLVFVKRRSKS